MQKYIIKAKDIEGFECKEIINAESESDATKKLYQQCSDTYEYGSIISIKLMKE
mgnify:CR=1 FL=1